MNVVSLRRPRDLTLYDTSYGLCRKTLASSIRSLVILRLPHQVCRHIDDHGVLGRKLSDGYRPMGWW